MVCKSVPAGPNSVAPVSRPATVMMADIIRCSMNGRAITISTGHQHPAATNASSAVAMAAQLGAVAVDIALMVVKVVP